MMNRINFNLPEPFTKATGTNIYTTYCQYYIIYTVQQNNMKGLADARQAMKMFYDIAGSC